ncbi:ATP-dependent DNA helicase chl1 [Elsinoe australis]|uniref:ATP-dependent DNA helicase chl1 n=1 Tax=Elsinoe australis TaxID=40998 RepID=A0A2P7ZQC9_9PEZI|nr:ATP-dependent DNA helicase chl1 [Elsinoe australis]
MSGPCGQPLLRPRIEGDEIHWEIDTENEDKDNDAWSDGRSLKGITVTFKHNNADGSVHEEDDNCNVGDWIVVKYFDSEHTEKTFAKVCEIRLCTFPDGKQDFLLCVCWTYEVSLISDDRIDEDAMDVVNALALHDRGAVLSDHFDIISVKHILLKIHKGADKNGAVSIKQCVFEHDDKKAKLYDGLWVAVFQPKYHERGLHVGTVKLVEPLPGNRVEEAEDSDEEEESVDEEQESVHGEGSEV